MMDEEDGWRDIRDGETVKTNTVFSNNNGVESKKVVTTSRKIVNGIPETVTTEEYEFPNGNKEVRRIRDDGRGGVTTKVYNLRRGEHLPIDG